MVNGASVVKVQKFKNGLTCAIKKREDLNSVTVTVWLKAGASYENEKNRGVAHFLEHMLFNGSANFPPGYIDREVESIGGEINAATSYDYTYYYITAPAECTERVIELLAELVLNPLLSEEMVEKEKPIVLEEIARSQDNPQEVFVEKFAEKLYRKAPYKYPILGFKETVESFSAETLREFYRKFYTPDRMVVVVVGNVNESQTEKLLEERFGKFERKPEKIPTPETEDVGERSGEFEMKSSLVAVPYVQMGWLLPPANRNRDVYLELLDSLLSSGRSSLLYRELKEKGLVFSTSSNYQNLLFGSNYSVTLMTETVEKAVEKTLALMRSIEEIPREEFEIAKEKLIKNEIFSRESGEAEADAIGFALSVMDEVEYFSEYIEDLKNAKYEEFLKIVSFLKEKPLIGYLIPQ